MSDKKIKQQVVKDRLFAETGCEYFCFDDNPLSTMFAPQHPMRFADEDGAKAVVSGLFDHLEAMVKKHDIRDIMDERQILAANFYMGQLFHDEGRKLLVIALMLPTNAMELGEEALAEIATGVGKVFAPGFAAMKKDLLAAKFVPRDVSEFIKGYTVMTDKGINSPSRT